MNKAKIALAFTLFSPLTLAGTVGDAKSESLWSPVIGINVGPAWAQSSQAQTLALSQDIYKTFSFRNPKGALVAGELFFGLQRALASQFQGQFGLALAAASYGRFSGTIWDDSEPRFNNHFYHYQVKHVHFALKAKLISGTHWFVSPWIAGSAGLGFNNTNHFGSRILIDEALPLPAFDSRTNKSFSYTFEAGLQRKVASNWTIGLGYQFSNWGKSRLGFAAGQTTNARLFMSHLYTHGLVFNMSYVG